MRRVPRRGKIPTQDWPAIVARYEAGETMTQIAQSYNCSPPAISYVVARSRARAMQAGQSTGHSTAPEPTPTDLKPSYPEAEAEVTDTSNVIRHSSRHTGLRVDHRHLGTAPTEARLRSGDVQEYKSVDAAEAASPHAHLHIERSAGKRNSGNSLIDADFRDRICADICAFLVALDSELVDDTLENRLELKAAADRLLNGGARTRIELERLDARAPLPQRVRLGSR